jgi:hypothetical protein
VHGDRGGLTGARRLATLGRVTRPPERGEPPRRRPSSSSALARLLALALVAGLAVAACGSSTIEPSSSPATPGESATAPSGSPSGSAAPSDGSSGPAAPSDTPADSAPPSADATPSAGDTGASECSGSVENRSFFTAAAANLPWAVYCAVLPASWFVEAGNYRLGGGGTLRIAYDGPAGARLELRQGAICADKSACHPSGEALGAAAFGDRDGALVALEGGGYEIVVDADQDVSWLAIGANLDEAAFRDIAAALHHVVG